MLFCEACTGFDEENLVYCRKYTTKMNLFNLGMAVIGRLRYTIENGGAE